MFLIYFGSTLPWITWADSTRFCLRKWKPLITFDIINKSEDFARATFLIQREFYSWFFSRVENFKMSIFQLRDKLRLLLLEATESSDWLLVTGFSYFKTEKESFILIALSHWEGIIYFFRFSYHSKHSCKHGDRLLYFVNLKVLSSLHVQRSKGAFFLKRMTETWEARGKSRGHSARGHVIGLRVRPHY